jgi:hypothetical protein
MAVSRRGLIAGFMLLLTGGYFVVDGVGKLGWTRLHATVTDVQLKCEMSSEQFGVLSRTTWDATIGCDAVQAFKITHPDKTWTVKHESLARLRLQSVPPIETSMMVYDEVPPRAGNVLEVVQDPNDPTRVLPAASSGFEVALGILTLVLAGLLFVLRFVIQAIGQRRRARAENYGRSPASHEPLPAATPALVSTPVAASAGRVFGRR